MVSFYYLPAANAAQRCARAHIQTWCCFHGWAVFGEKKKIKISDPWGSNASSRINFWAFSQTHISKSELKNGHISRFCSIFQVIQVISSAKFFLLKKLTSTSIQKRRNTPRFRSLLFEKEIVKTFFYQCSNLGRNESTPQTQNNVSWVSSRAELEISFLNSLSEMWVWESGWKIDPATGVSGNCHTLSSSK